MMMMMMLSFILLSSSVVLDLFVDGLATPTRRIGRRRRGPSSNKRQGTSQDKQGGGGSGFGTTSSSSPIDDANDDANASKTKRNGRIYSMPALYDLAFGYRNYQEEVSFLIEQHQLLHQGQPPRRVLELAAGPARHSIEALKALYVQSATALDNCPEMIEYAKDIASQELGKEKKGALNYVQADMTNFKIPLAPEEECDSAWMLLGSLQHLTTNPEVISCFQCIHRVLKTDGTLIIELPHPRETFSLVECTRNGWEIPLEDEDGNTSGELRIVWGDDNDHFDPIRQVRQFTVSMELEGVDDKATHNTQSTKILQSVKEVVPLRHFTSQEIDALARLSGFEVESMHGALAKGVDVNDEDEAFRLVCVLQKKEGGVTASC